MSAAAPERAMAKKKPTQRASPARPKSRATPAETPHAPTGPEKRRFPVVGIGASAGGVEATLDFFRAIKPDNGMAFAVVMHLDPEHKSAFPEILSKVTRMTVTEARDGAAMDQNK